jgi:hypothetical protein
MSILQDKKQKQDERSLVHKDNMKNPNAVALGSLGGKSTSKAKIRASKENGKKGGRPKKPTEDSI